jgi:TRAP-type C4-dicarboxylate transport system substrate-binding protein
VLAAVGSAGCSGHPASSSADKSGGSGAAVVLRLADSDESDDFNVPAVQYFADRVARISRGALRVHVTYAAAGTTVPDTDARTAELVRAGKFDLGWIDAGAWDELGVRSFQALQAPFLITSYDVLDLVATGPEAGRMLAGLNGHGVVGLALVPDLLRHPVGLVRPLASPADFAGARVRVEPSRAKAALITALGAMPRETGSFVTAAAGARGVLDGEVVSLAEAPGATIVTANITFYAKVLTLFAGQGAFARLSGRQRQVLLAAAAQTVRHVADRPPSESALAGKFCHAGRVVLASRSEIEQLEREARPAALQLERNPLTRALIEQIRRLKAAAPGDPSLILPAGCSRPRSVDPKLVGKRLPPSILNGTYRWVMTAAAARAFGWPATNPGNIYPVVSTLVLRDGRWQGVGQHPDHGTYILTRDQIRFDWPSFGYGGLFGYTRERNGTLHLKAVQPMDRGDQFVWSNAPWRRIAGPVENI